MGIRTVFICDGCGKESEGERRERKDNSRGGYDLFKPSSWYHREDADGIQLACSKECVKSAAEKSGKTGIVAPSFL